MAITIKDENKLVEIIFKHFTGEEKNQTLIDALDLNIDLIDEILSFRANNLYETQEYFQAVYNNLKLSNVKSKHFKELLRNSEDDFLLSEPILMIKMIVMLNALRKIAIGKGQNLEYKLALYILEKEISNDIFQYNYELEMFYSEFSSVLSPKREIKSVNEIFKNENLVYIEENFKLVLVTDVKNLISKPIYFFVEDGLMKMEIEDNYYKYSKYFVSLDDLKDKFTFELMTDESLIYKFNIKNTEINERVKGIIQRYINREEQEIISIDFETEQKQIYNNFKGIFDDYLQDFLEKSETTLEKNTYRKRIVTDIIDILKYHFPDATDYFYYVASGHFVAEMGLLHSSKRRIVDLDYTYDNKDLKTEIRNIMRSKIYFD